MNSWPELDAAQRRKEAALAEAKEQERKRIKREADKKSAEVQRRTEGIRLITQMWDATIRDLLTQLATATWSESKRDWADRGKPWEITYSVNGFSSMCWMVRASGSDSYEYYRVCLAFDTSFLPTQLGVECADRIKIEAEVDKLKAALVEAYERGPAYHEPFENFW